MSALLTADPGAVRTAALALDCAAADAAALGRQLDRQQPSCWRGPSSRDYSYQLTALSGRVARIGRSHDAAAETLVSYARDLEEAQDRARYAEQLAAEGQRRSAAWADRRVVGPDPGACLLHAAQRTRLDAEALERAAAARAAARLRELAAAAPEQGWTSKLLRPLEDVVLSTVVGVREAPRDLAVLAGAAWSAVPWVHGRREQEQGRAALVDAAKVWQTWLEAGRDAANGRPGLAAGALLGGALPGRRIKPDGHLAGVEERLLRVRDVGDAWDQAHAAKALQDRIVRLRDVPLPGLEALLRGEVDLAHHEARGGHTILKHVGARLITLQARLDLEARGKRDAYRSTFPDLATAEALVRTALLANKGQINALAEGRRGGSRELRLSLDAPVGTVLHADGTITPGRSVIVILKKSKGEVRVQTAFLGS